MRIHLHGTRRRIHSRTHRVCWNTSQTHDTYEFLTRTHCRLKVDKKQYLDKIVGKYK